MNCMVMPMSEDLRAKLNASDALAHAGEVAHWTLLLLGWLWLGEQGSRLGWSLASGVMPVALWWTESAEDKLGCFAAHPCSSALAVCSPLWEWD